jgi:hypothetical protein
MGRWARRLVVVCGALALCLPLAGQDPGTAVPAAPPSQSADEASQSAVQDDRVFDEPFDFSQPPPIPEFVAPTAEEIEESIKRGVDFLLSVQNPDGSWGSHVSSRDFEIYAPIPGAHQAFRAATTGLVVTALLDAAPDRQDVQEAVDRGEAWLLKELPDVKRATGDAMYNVWAHAYGIKGLVRLHQRASGNPERQAELKDLIAQQLDMLDRYESVDGGWGYYDFRYQARKPTSDSISFVNATALMAIYEAKQIGVPINQRTVDRAVAATLRQQKPDFSYLYGEYLKDNPVMHINRPGGSLARSQSCNLALRVWGDEKITDHVLKWWLVRLYVRNGWLDIGRKLPIPHESWMSVSGYFYYYGHYYAGLVIELLPPEERAPYQGMLARILIDHQEPNGCWWDYPMYNYHRQYGTAYSVSALAHCRPAK